MKIVAVRFVLFSRVEMFLFPLVFHNFFITRVLSFCCNSTASVFFLLREFASNREIQCLAGFLKCVVLREFCSMFCEFRRKHFFFTKMRHICSRESVQHFTLWLFCSGFFSCQSGLGCLPSATEFFPLQKDLLAFVTRLRQTFERGKMFNIFPRLFTLHLSSGLLFTVRFRNCFVLFCCVCSFFFFKQPLSFSFLNFENFVSALQRLWRFDKWDCLFLLCSSVNHLTSFFFLSQLALWRLWRFQ